MISFSCQSPEANWFWSKSITATFLCLPVLQPVQVFSRSCQEERVTKQARTQQRVWQLLDLRNTTILTSAGTRDRLLSKNAVITCHPGWSWTDLQIFLHWCNTLWFSDNLRQMHVMTGEILWTWYTAVLFLGQTFTVIVKQTERISTVVSAKHQGHLQSHCDLAADLSTIGSNHSRVEFYHWKATVARA